jgi:phosphoenolpyruvate synthase/pyruvate phosphate dikinase
MLKPDGGSEVVPSTGHEYVLTEKEIKEVTAAAIKINKKFKPVRDASGNPRPWDIEFGFTKGQLWLFQARPFVGNEEIQNLPALASLEVATASAREDISLDEVVR